MNRFHIVVQHFLRQNTKTIKHDYVVLKPSEANKLEPVLKTVDRYFTKIDFGCSIKKFESFYLTKFQLNQFMNENYCLNFDLRSKFVCFI
jgi:hypothetical protein